VLLVRHVSSSLFVRRNVSYSTRVPFQYALWAPDFALFDRLFRRAFSGPPFLARLFWPSFSHATLTAALTAALTVSIASALAVALTAALITALAVALDVSLTFALAVDLTPAFTPAYTRRSPSSFPALSNSTAARNEPSFDTTNARCRSPGDFPEAHKLFDVKKALIHTQRKESVAKFLCICCIEIIQTVKL
jgi:hypothetical protein